MPKVFRHINYGYSSGLFRDSFGIPSGFLHQHLIQMPLTLRRNTLKEMNKPLKKIILASTLFLGLANLQAQDTWNLSWHGFVNPHFYADSRQVVGGREDMMLFYPEPANFDANNEDINASPSINLLSITARLGLSIEGPDFLGAKTRGYIEGDFTGSTNASNNDLRLRHAYINMNWGERELLMGQYWYAMTIHEIMPGTCPLNMGAPFHPYARYNQLRYTEHIGKIELVGVAAFQTDNMSQGPLGNSTSYLRNSCIPELTAQLRYKDDQKFFGLAANLLTIKPREFTTNIAGTKTYKTDKKYTSLAYTAFGRINFPHFNIKAQAILNDNLYEGCTMGGYIEQQMAKEGMYSYNYEDWHYNTIWCDMGVTTGNWRPGFFAGYAKNMSFGQSQLNDATQTYSVFGRGYNIEYLWRVQPRIEFVAGKGLSFFGEIEYTYAQYGKKMTDLSSEYYAHDDNGGVGNWRFMISAVYKF